MQVPNDLLIAFENATGLGSTYAARVLGIAYPTYAQYRSGRRPLQLYHARHIEALLLLSQQNLNRIIKEHAFGTDAS